MLRADPAQSGPTPEDGPRRRAYDRSKDATDTRASVPWSCGRSAVELYNGVRPHASLGFRPPAPEVVLPAFAACFLGETSVRRGYYNVWGTLTAVFLIAAGTTGLFMLGAEAYVHDGRARAEVYTQVLDELGHGRSGALVAELREFNDALDRAHARLRAE